MTWKYNSEKDNKMGTLKKSDFKQTYDVFLSESLMIKMRHLAWTEHVQLDFYIVKKFIHSTMFNDLQFKKLHKAVWKSSIKLTEKLLLSFFIPDAATLKSWRSISEKTVSWKKIIIIKWGLKSD